MNRKFFKKHSLVEVLGVVIVVDVDDDVEVDVAETKEKIS